MRLDLRFILLLLCFLLSGECPPALGVVYVVFERG
jgi:hypothetical protein